MVRKQEKRTAERLVCVPVMKEVERPYTVMVPHQEQRTAERLVCRQVMREVERPYTVMVPHQEVRHGERTVCQYVPTTETRYVCRDMGHWEAVAAPCGPAYGCGSCFGC